MKLLRFFKAKLKGLKWFAWGICLSHRKLILRFLSRSPLLTLYVDLFKKPNVEIIGPFWKVSVTQILKWFFSAFHSVWSQVIAQHSMFGEFIYLYLLRKVQYLWQKLMRHVHVCWKWIHKTLSYWLGYSQALNNMIGKLLLVTSLIFHIWSKFESWNLIKKTLLERWDHDWIIKDDEFRNEDELSDRIGGICYFKLTSYCPILMSSACIEDIFP